MKANNTLRNNIRRRKRKGFTLVEIMVVLFIMMVIASMAMLAVRSYMENAYKKEAGIFVRSLETPIETFHMDHRQYPNSLEDLLSPPSYVDQAKGTWPYIKMSAAKTDPWGSPYQYVVPGSHNPESYDLWSLGPDGTPDTADDIGNWN